MIQTYLYQGTSTENIIFSIWEGDAWERQSLEAVTQAQNVVPLPHIIQQFGEDPSISGDL